MRRFTILALFPLVFLSAQATTRVPTETGVLLDEKTIVELTAGFNQYEYLPALKGKLVSAGSGLVTILINRWASEFAELYPDVTFEIGGAGSTSSLPDFLAGKLDLMPMARPLTSDELTLCKEKLGHDPAQVVVAQDAIGVYVNKSNPVAGLTFAQLDGIYSRRVERGGAPVEFWRDLGVEGPLAEKRISRFALSKAHGTHELFRDTVMLGAEYRFDVSFESVFSSLVQSVGADDAGIGFTSVMFATARTHFVPLQAVDGSFLLPTYENTVSGRYPLVRPMRIVFRREPDGSMNPVVREFLRFAVSRRGQRIIALSESYPLTLEQHREALRIVDDAREEPLGTTR